MSNDNKISRLALPLPKEIIIVNLALHARQYIKTVFLTEQTV